MKASSTYPIDNIRDADLGEADGPHAVDHGLLALQLRRAAGGQHRPVDDLIPQIGPYDMWATKWGYAPIQTRRRRTRSRRRWTSGRASRTTKPYLRFSTSGPLGSDPGEVTEAVGDADAVKATELGVKNLKRVAKMLMPATAAKRARTYDDLVELYNRMVSQWRTEMNHVATIVGGFNSQEKTVGQEGPRSSACCRRTKQAAAVKFLLDERVHDARLHDRRGDSAADRAGGRDRPDSQRADGDSEHAAEQRAVRAADGAVDAGRHPGLLAGGVSGHGAHAACGRSWTLPAVKSTRTAASCNGRICRRSTGS